MLAAELAAFQAVASTYSLNRAQAATYFVAVVLSTDPTSLGLSTVPNPGNPGGLSDAQTYSNQFNAATNRTIVSGNFANQSAGASSLNYPVVGPTTNAGYIGAVNSELGVSNFTSTVVTAENQIAVAAAANNPALITGQYSPGTTYTLTTGVDYISVSGNGSTVVGTANGTSPTFNAGDTILFNSTSGGQFNINDASAAGATVWTPTTLAGVTVSASGVGTFGATFNGTNAVVANTSSSAQGYNGLTSLTINSNAQGAAVDVVTAKGTTDVTVNDSTAAVVTADLTVTGGKTVSITEANNTFANAARTITNTGVAGTTSSSVKQTWSTGGTTQKVAISDVNGASASLASTLATVSVDGLNGADDTTAAVITTGALSNLTLKNITPTAGQTKTTVITNNQSGTAATTLQLNLDNNFTAATIAQGNYALKLVDTNNEIKVLNITTGNTASTLATGVTASQLDINTTAWTGLTTVTVNGASQLVLGSLGSASALASFAVSGNAGVSADVSGLGSKLTSITNTNNGSAINDFQISNTLQSYSHTGTARDIITIGGRTTKSIVAGGASNNTIVANYTSSAGQNVTNGGTVTGFTTLGLGTASQGTFDLAAITGISAIQVFGLVAGTTTVTGASPTTSLAFSTTSTPNFTYNITGSAGATSTLNMALGLSATDQLVTNGLAAATSTANVLGGTFTAADASGNGIGTLNVTSYSTTAGEKATIDTLADTKLSTLNISGTAGLDIGTFTTGTSASLTINNTSSSSGTSTISTLTDANLTSLSFTGTGKTTITTLNTSTQPSLTINQNSSGTTAITTLTDTALSTLNFAGSGAMTIVALNTSSALLTINNTDTASSGLTVTTLTDATLSTLNLSGSGNTTITTLVDTLAGALNILDSSTGTSTITNMTAVNLTSLTAQNSNGGTLIIGNATAANAGLININLLGDVQYTNTHLSGTVAYTVNGSTDNANVAITIGGTTAAATTNIITLGNGNNTISNASQNVLANATITLGNGNNTVTMGIGLSTVKVGTGSNAIDSGVDAVADQTEFVTANGGSTSSFTAVTNFLAADTLKFANAAINTTITNLGTVGSVEAGVAGFSTTAGYTTFTVGTDTYVYQNTGTVANNELVETVGAHTYTATSTTLLTFLS